MACGASPLSPGPHPLARPAPPHRGPADRNSSEQGGGGAGPPGVRGNSQGGACWAPGGASWARARGAAAVKGEHGAMACAACGEQGAGALSRQGYEAVNGALVRHLVAPAWPGG